MSDAELPGRIPPHNEEAERALLGALLSEPIRIPEVAEIVRVGDFFNPRHDALYEVLESMAERSAPIDIVSVGEALVQAGQFQKVGGRAYLAELSSSVTSGVYAKHHARIVSETAILRRLIREAGEIIGDAYATRPDGENVPKLLDVAENRIFEIANEHDRGDAVPLAKAVAETFRRIDSSSHRRGLTGLPTGFPDLDELLSGFNQGELIIVAARPSMGKTAFVLNCMDRAADPDRTPEWLQRPAVVLFFSLEMGQQSIVRRMLCSRAGVDAHKLRTGHIPHDDYADLARAAGELERLKMFIDDTPGITAMSLRSRARRIQQKHGLDMIVVDYLQLMSHPKAENRQQEISQISRSLKELARELNIPVVALSQLSRQVELRKEGKTPCRPQLADLRESGSIEQDADVVLLLYRQEYYDRDNPEVKGTAEVICAKQRNGPTGDILLRFNAPIMRFENRAPSMAETFTG